MVLNTKRKASSSGVKGTGTLLYACVLGIKHDLLENLFYVSNKL